jgi:IstB-like ATP binding protein
VQIFESGNLIATHPVLEGRKQRRIAPGHRKMPRFANHRRDEAIVIVRTGDTVAIRPLDFYQLVNARYKRGAMILTSNRGFAEWGEVFGDPVVATALLDRLLHHAVVIQIEGSSYRLRQHADLMPENVRSKALINSPVPTPSSRRRGRLPKNGASDHTTG